MVTTSGMCSAEPLNCTIAALGHDRVMFAADYPFDRPGREFLDTVPLDEGARRYRLQQRGEAVGLIRHGPCWITSQYDGWPAGHDK